MNTGGPSAFKKLVRLLARACYAGACPPKDSNEPRGKWEKVETTGLGIVILDSLTQREWVKEDLLAEELKIAPKLLRRALRYLEEEQILRREHRKEGKRAQNKDVVVLATKGTPEEGVEGQPVKARLHSYCAIDYPRFIDMLQLRVHLMKDKLKSELEEKSPLMNYICSTCGTTFNSLDFNILLDRETGLLRCDECGTEVLEQFGTDGQTGNAEDRKKRREKMRKLLQALERDMKPVFEQMTLVKGIQPPDYGSLTDWAVSRRRAEMARAQAATKGDSNAVAETNWEPNFDVDLSGPTATDHPSGGKGQEEESTKGPPPWMLRQGMQSSTASPSAAMADPLNLTNEGKQKMDKKDIKGVKLDQKPEVPYYDGDAHFKKYMEEVKRKEAYSGSVEAAKKLDKKEGKKREAAPSLASNKPLKKSKSIQNEDQWEDVPKSTLKDDHPKTDDFEWEDAGGNLEGIQWESAENNDNEKNEEDEPEWEDVGGYNAEAVS